MKLVTSPAIVLKRLPTATLLLMRLILLPQLQLPLPSPLLPKSQHLGIDGLHLPYVIFIFLLFLYLDTVTSHLWLLSCIYSQYYEHTRSHITD